MLNRSARTVLLGAVTLAACGTSPADIEEIKKGQKDILSKLDSLDKAVQQVKAAAPAQRPQVDPNKVYNIPIANSTSAVRRPPRSRSPSSPTSNDPSAPSRPVWSTRS